MNWIASRTGSACAKLPLVELLQDQLDEATTVKVVAHLDRCQHCQRRLTEISADARWWRDAAVWLENAALDDTDEDSELLSEFDEPHGPTVETSLIQSGLMVVGTKLEMIGSIGRYDIRRVIGTGGTGIVLQAVDSELDRVVALKVLSPTLASNGAARRRFSREGQSAASVVHDNVVAIHHVESNGPVPYLVMQYIDGSSLQELVMRSGPIETTTALRMVAQLSAALEAAHAQGLVHRDVKPANILVGSAGQRVWITDFGLARAVDDASLTRTGFIAGTPHYMSPEQARGESVSARSDLFGLGSVLYFALTGRPPFRADRSLAILNRICNERHRSVREVNPEVSVAVESLVDRLLQKDPRARFQTAEEVRLECLRVLTQTEAVSSDAMPTATYPARRPYRLKLLTTSAVTLFAVAVLSLGWLGQFEKSVAAFWRVNQPENTDKTGNRTTTPTLANQLRDNRLNQPRLDNSNEAQPKFARDPTSPTTSPDSANDLSSSIANAIQPESDLWTSSFYDLQQEIDGTLEEWKSHDSALLPSIGWASELFEQMSFEVEGMLRELESPYGVPIEESNLNPNSRSGYSTP